MDLDLKKALKVAEKTTTLAGNFLLDFQQDVLITQKKDLEDIQTDADLKAEKIVIEQISKNFPDHNILSEEQGLIDNKSEFTWVIDPLDGTKEYFRGLSTYSSLLSLQSNSELLVSSCYVPRTNELYSAAKEIGSFLNHKTKLHVSSQKKLNQSLILCHPVNNKLKEPHFSEQWKVLEKISQQAYRLRPTWYDSWFMGQMAQGGFEAYCALFNQGPKWHDIASGLTLIEQAGGKVTDRYGKPLKHGNLEDGIVASNGLIHQQLLSIINLQG